MSSREAGAKFFFVFFLVVAQKNGKMNFRPTKKL